MQKTNVTKVTCLKVLENRYLKLYINGRIRLVNMVLNWGYEGLVK